MKILAIETSSEQGSLALQKDGLVFRCLLDRAGEQSATALTKLRELLAQGGIDLRELDAIAFGAGPGMFTGLRLGCGLAQGLAIGAGLPLVRVSSLLALANRCSGERVVVATDARMGEIYCQCFERTGTFLAPVGMPQCIPPEQFFLPPGPARWSAIGSAFSAYWNRFDVTLLDSISLAADNAPAHASDLLTIAARYLAAGKVTAPQDAVPEYVRDKVALTTRERLERGARA